METTVVNTLVQVFSFESEENQVRIIGTADDPKFCLADICKVLGLPQVAKVVQRLDKEVLSRHPLTTAGGTQEMYFVNEDGFYDVVLESRKPIAKKFRKWVTSEVLPSIRKTGSYNAKPMDEFEVIVAAANEMLAQRKKIKALEEQAANHNTRLTALEREKNNPFSKSNSKEWQQDKKLQDHEDRIHDIETVFEDKGPGEEIKSLISDAVNKYGNSYQDAYNKFYRYLKSDYGINLSARLSNLKKRMETQGWSKSKINTLTILDAINSSPNVWEKIRDAIQVVREGMNND